MRELRFVKSVAELRTGDNKRTAVGTAVVFDKPSHPIGYGAFREVFSPDAFRDYLGKDTELLALCHHDMTQVVGRASAGTLRYKVDKEGLHVECDLPNTTYANDLSESLSRRDIQGMSFAFDAVDDEWSLKDGEPFRYVKRAKIYEVSFVTDPAYPQTTADLQRSREHIAARLAEFNASASYRRDLWKWKMRYLGISKA